MGVTVYTNEKHNAAVLGKAVHPHALRRLHELWPTAVVHVRHATYPVELPHGTMRMDMRYYAQPEHETFVVIDLTGEERPGTGDKAIGEATCHPLDRYERRKGIALAFTRALDHARKLHDPEAWQRAKDANKTKAQLEADRKKALRA